MNVTCNTDFDYVFTGKLQITQHTVKETVNNKMASMSFSMPKSAVDQLKGFISLCKSRPEIIHNEELAFFRDYLLSMGATLPPKPEGGAAPDAGKKPDSKPAPEPAKEEPAEMEVEESDESDVELDMEGVIGKISRHGMAWVYVKGGIAHCHCFRGPQP